MADKRGKEQNEFQFQSLIKLSLIVSCIITICNSTIVFKTNRVSHIVKKKFYLVVYYIGKFRFCTYLILQFYRKKIHLYIIHKKSNLGQFLFCNFMIFLYIKKRLYYI